MTLTSSKPFPAGHIIVRHGPESGGSEQGADPLGNNIMCS